MPRTTVTKKTSKKSVVEQSIVKSGHIYCVNHRENSTPYWGGHTCDTHIDHDGQIVRWVCSSCVARLVPGPKSKNSPKVDPVTGEKRKRGRPLGSKNKPKTTATTVSKTSRKGKK